jgi:hypothetical protein
MKLSWHSRSTLYSNYATDLTVGGSNLSRGKGFFSSPKLPDQL